MSLADVEVEKVECVELRGMEDKNPATASTARASRLIRTDRRDELSRQFALNGCDTRGSIVRNLGGGE
jgi:hypothetical protein